MLAAAKTYPRRAALVRMSLLAVSDAKASSVLSMRERANTKFNCFHPNRRDSAPNGVQFTQGRISSPPQRWHCEAIGGKGNRPSIERLSVGSRMVARHVAHSSCLANRATATKILHSGLMPLQRLTAAREDRRTARKGRRGWGRYLLPTYVYLSYTCSMAAANTPS